VRLTQLDHDRDIAFVALDDKTGELAGVARLSCDPDHVTGEYGLLVRSDLQGRGLGWTLLSQIIDYARQDGVKRIEGVVLSENARMLEMCREFGFTIGRHPEGAGLSLASLELA
jgi:acetyltransferase